MELLIIWSDINQQLVLDWICHSSPDLVIGRISLKLCSNFVFSGLCFIIYLSLFNCVYHVAEFVCCLKFLLRICSLHPCRLLLIFGYALTLCFKVL